MSFIQAALIAGQLWLGEITRPRPHKVTFEEFAGSNEPSEIRPPAYVGGTVEVTPQRIWYGDFSARAVERDSHWTDYLWAGVLAGLLDFITVAYRYYIGEVFLLSWGPDTHVEQIKISERLMFQAALGTDNAGSGFLIDDPQAWGGDQPPGEGGEYAWCDITRGNYTDHANSYLNNLLRTPPNNIPALQGISLLVKYGRSGYTESGYFAAGGVGFNPHFKEWKITLRRQPDNLATGFHQLGRHMNAVETIYEWSTSFEYGAACPVSELNLDSFRACAQTLYEEYQDGASAGAWSGKIETQTHPQEVVQNVLQQIDGILDPSPSLGLTMRLIRRDYTFGSLRELNRSNVTTVERLTPGTYEDTVNKVIVPYHDLENNSAERPALYIDPANQQIQGGRIVPETKEYIGIGDSATANLVATRDGRALSIPRAPLTCSVLPSFGRLTYRGEVLLFTWSSPTFTKVMRVLAITPGNSHSPDYRLVLIEDQFAIGFRTFGEPGETGWEDPGAGLDDAPPDASWDTSVAVCGLVQTTILTNTNQFQSVIEGHVLFDTTYTPGGQYGRIYVTEPGGVQTLSPLYLSPNDDGEATFTWPAIAVGNYEFCIQTYSLLGATSGNKVCCDIDIAAIGSPSYSPSASISPSTSPSTSPSVSASLSPSSSISPSTSASVSPSHSASPSASQSPSGSQSPSASLSPSSSASPSGTGTPSDLADIWAWWEPSREGGLSNGDPMPTLTDQTGNSRDWTQVTSVNRPKYDTSNALNGLAVANLGSGLSLSFPNIGWNGPNMSALTAAHVFLIVKVDADPNSQQEFTGLWHIGNNTGDTFKATHYSWQGDGHIYESALRTARVDVGNPTPALTSWRVYEISSIANEWKVFLDGSQVGSTQTTSTVGLPSSPTLGVSHDPFYYIRGFIAGMYLFSAKKTGTDRDDLIDYINTRFGLSSS